MVTLDEGGSPCVGQVCDFFPWIKKIWLFVYDERFFGYGRVSWSSGEFFGYVWWFRF